MLMWFLDYGIQNHYGFKGKTSTETYFTVKVYLQKDKTEWIDFI